MKYLIKLMSSSADGEKLFAKIGRYLASPEVRRDCGGYPLNDGADYHWLLALNKRDLKPCGFLSFEHTAKSVHIHAAYIDPAARGTGVYRELLRQCLHYVDHHKVDAIATVQEASAAALCRNGFKETGRRGSWIRIERKTP